MSIETAAAASAAGMAAAKGAGGAALGGAVVGGLGLSTLVVMLLKQPRTSREWAVAGNDAAFLQLNNDGAASAAAFTPEP